MVMKIDSNINTEYLYFNVTTFDRVWDLFKRRIREKSSCRENEDLLRLS